MLLPLAGMIVYSDKILRWASRKPDKIYDWRHVILIETASIGLLIVGAHLLMRTCAGFACWNPIAMVGLWLVLQVISMQAKRD